MENDAVGELADASIALDFRAKQHAKPGKLEGDTMDAGGGEIAPVDALATGGPLRVETCNSEEMAPRKRAPLLLPIVIIQEIFKFVDLPTIFNCESISYAAVEARKHRRADIELVESAVRSAHGNMFTLYFVSPWIFPSSGAPVWHLTFRVAWASLLREARPIARISYRSGTKGHYSTVTLMTCGVIREAGGTMSATWPPKVHEWAGGKGVATGDLVHVWITASSATLTGPVGYALNVSLNGTSEHTTREGRFSSIRCNSYKKTEAFTFGVFKRSLEVHCDDFRVFNSGY